MLELCAGHSHVDCLGTGCLKLRPGLLDLNFRANSSLEPGHVQLQGLLIILNSGVQELLLGIQAARLEIEQGKLRMHAQVDRRQVGSTGLRLLAKGLHILAHSSPRVHLI